MIAPLARIVARYTVGGLIVYGLVPSESASAIEQDVALLVATGLGVAVEGVYALAKKKGWAT